MRLDLVKIFLDSTRQTFQQIVDPVAEVNWWELQASAAAGSEVMAIIGITGDVYGQVIFDMRMPTAIQVVELMMQQETPVMTPLASSAIAELASIATGRALSDINNNGLVLGMSPPVVICGADLASHHTGLETLVAPIVTSFGEVRINIIIQDIS